MADEPSVRIADGVSRCLIPDGGGAGGTVPAPLLEITPTGALIDSAAAFELNTYIDVTLELAGIPPRNLFAFVQESGAAGLRVQWLHIDPADLPRMRELIGTYREALRKAALPPPAPAGDQAAGATADDGDAFTPFADAAPASTRAGWVRSGSRRFLRVRRDDAPAAAPADPPTTSAGTAQIPVVVAGTDAFEQLPRRPAEPAPAQENPALTSKPVEPHQPQEMVKGTDGKVDIGASIRSRAKTVRASELAARHDRVRVLNMATIKTLIQQAVEEAASHLTRSLDEAERKRLLTEAEEAFQERMKEFQAQKLDAEARSRQLQEQLDSARTLLEAERKREITADQFTVSAKGMEDIEAAFSRVIERSTVNGALDPGLEEQVRKLATSVLDEERQRIREKELGAQNDKIELLEKKIRRLSTNLEETERQRDEAREIAQHLEKFAGQGLSVDQIKNKYQAGLRGDDPNRGRKLAIMKELIEENRELRRALGLPSGPQAEPPPEAAPAPAPAPAPEPEPEPEPEPQPSATAPADGGQPEVDPDDLPWEPPAVEPAAEVDPDDLPWEPPAPAAAPAAAGGVKRISVVQREPPPLKPR